MMLSTAIRKGNDTDPFEAALTGQMANWDLKRYNSHKAGMSRESLCELRIRALHAQFPQLGQSVRAYPVLARMMEDNNVLPRVRPWQLQYRQEIHKSLWGCIAHLHDVSGWWKDQIAEELAKAGL